MDGHQLHRVRRRCRAGGCARSRSPGVVGHLLAQPGQQCHQRRAAPSRRASCSDSATWRRSVSSRSPSTSAEHPRLEAAAARRPSRDGGDAAPAKRSAQSRSRGRRRSVSRVAAGVELVGGVPEEGGQRRGPHPRRRGAAAPCASSSASHSLRGRRAEDAAAAGDHRGHPGLGQRLAEWWPGGVRGRRSRRRRRLQRPAVEGGPGGEQRATSRGRGRGPRAADARRRRRAGRRACRSGPGSRTPQPERRRRGAPASRLRVAGADGVHDDPLVAELGSAEHDLQALDQRGVAAPVDAEGAAGAGGRGGRR